MAFKIEMMAQVTDRVTGYSGRVTGRAEYETGCHQYLVVPRCLHGEDSKMPEGNWIDEGRLVEAEVAAEIDPGGPHHHPPRRS